MPAKKKKSTKAKSSIIVSPLRQIHHVVTENVEASVAMVSIFINIFFLTGLVMYHTSPSFQGKVYRYDLTHYCSDRKDDETVAIYEITCHKGQYQPFYEKSITDYQALLQSK